MQGSRDVESGGGDTHSLLELEWRQGRWNPAATIASSRCFQTLGAQTGDNALVSETVCQQWERMMIGLRRKMEECKDAPDHVRLRI